VVVLESVRRAGGVLAQPAGLDHDPIQLNRIMV
jgi:hypothetical protein